MASLVALHQRRSGTHPVVYEVAGGNHVTILLARDETEATVDVIEVLARPGGGRLRTGMPSASGFACWPAS